ncbi:FtsW/RodA/SpoVE family cell cycle protein [Synergistes jonesii]|uniref:Probable peptidoglycan glycosyltransferase FtsW n=1 Tax=Synergistes jonesii TaxID=2754 RepID=A0A073J2F4_9BACT|nr:putative peptidoglycan glycosyltransferase FtsW [Synergistes jonesii]KEJ91887.1 cell cycle protein [Synergistes jonesii]OFB61042.1 cell cycle protein [Synergistes jonesii]OFB61171.1 cell cycle protein [Synergistes jonesii]OFB62100.1 cell cycle protein [Synergistes jonesii]OFB67111.1 cell cycle protein [Synergistes jonesii]
MTEQSEAESKERGYKANPFIWVIPLILSGIGILMITSTTSPTSFIYTGTPFQMGIKQLRWLGIALCGMFFVYSVPIRIWYKYSSLLLILMWFVSWLPLFPGVGEAIGGARRWIRLPGLAVSLQPGELLCLAVALHVAKLLSRKAERDPLKSFTMTMILTLLAVLPLIAQPDLGTTILIFTVAMGMYVEKVGWRYPLFAGGSIAAAALPMLIVFEPYRMRRLLAWLDPWRDPLNKGFQAIQGLIAFANGGLWGSGLGHGFQKLNYLPAAYTDFIYAAVGEELGFAGTLCILALFAFWLMQTRDSYFRSEDSFKATLIWGISLTILLPLVINVAGVTKMIPLTGMPLPFVSYGGTSLVTMWARVGLLLRLEKDSWFGGEEFDGA